MEKVLSSRDDIHGRNLSTTSDEGLAATIWNAPSRINHRKTATDKKTKHTHTKNNWQRFEKDISPEKTGSGENPGERIPISLRHQGENANLPETPPCRCSTGWKTEDKTELDGPRAGCSHSSLAGAQKVTACEKRSPFLIEAGVACP